MYSRRMRWDSIPKGGEKVRREREREKLTSGVIESREGEVVGLIKGEAEVVGVGLLLVGESVLEVPVARESAEVVGVVTRAAVAGVLD